MVLLSAYKSPYLHASVGTGEFETAWNHCISILEYYQRSLRSAANALTVLLTVRQQLSQANANQGMLHVLSYN